MVALSIYFLFILCPSSIPSYTYIPILPLQLIIKYKHPSPYLQSAIVCRAVILIQLKKIPAISRIPNNWKLLLALHHRTPITPNANAFAGGG